VASPSTKHGVAVITAAISPYAEARLQARKMIGDFVEVRVHSSLEELLRRDVKGLYARALAEEIQTFTGVSDPYEAPVHPDVHVDAEHESVEESVAYISSVLEQRGYIASSALLTVSVA